MNQEQKHLRVSIVEGMWNGEGNLKLVAALTEWQAMTLYLWGNSRPTLLREISHIQFPKLQEINLANNQISTIEGISHILMPHLETISFWRNDLTRLKPLRKVFWLRLARLTIVENFICDGQLLSECFFPSLECVQADDLMSEGERWQKNLTDLRFFLKFQTESMGGIGINLGRSVIQPHIEKYAKKKWIDLEIQE